MADSRMDEEEGHCNLLLEMIKKERKNVNVTIMITDSMVFFSTPSLRALLFQIIGPYTK